MPETLDLLEEADLLEPHADGEEVVPGRTVTVRAVSCRMRARDEAD